MYNAAVKTDGRYTLKIVHDEDAPNPRKEHDNFGRMACWHSRYNLGDRHDYKEPEEFLADLVRHTVSESEIVAYVKDGKAAGLTLEYNLSEREWELKSYNEYFKKWYTEVTFSTPLPNNRALLSESVLDNMRTGDLMELAERTHLIVPLYLYDHSIQSISTDSFLGRAHHADWDSGRVGFVYVSHMDIAEKYGNVAPESIEKARKLLDAETEAYDCYLRGECYGFLLYKDGEEADRCWGFLGSFRDAKQAIREYVPEEAAALIDGAHYGDDDPEYDPDKESEM